MQSVFKIVFYSTCLSAASQEQERKAYDETYSSNRELFSAAPNAFMVRMIAGRKPGRALDVAMGQGRNSLWLASQGWTVSGFDISLVAVGEARKAAAKRGLKIETFVAPYEQFDWGKGGLTAPRIVWCGCSFRSACPCLLAVHGRAKTIKAAKPCVGVYPAGRAAPKDGDTRYSVRNEGPDSRTPLHRRCFEF